MPIHQVRCLSIQVLNKVKEFKNCLILLLISQIKIIRLINPLQKREKANLLNLFRNHNGCDYRYQQRDDKTQNGMDDLAPTQSSATSGKSVIPVVVGMVHIIINFITITEVVVVVVNDAVFFPVIATITALSTLVLLIISAITIAIAVTIIDRTNHVRREKCGFCIFSVLCHGSWTRVGVMGLFATRTTLSIR